jgi:hypothetical protein
VRRERVIIDAMVDEPATPEQLEEPSSTDSELDAIQAKLRRLAEELAGREKLHEDESADTGEGATPPG